MRASFEQLEALAVRALAQAAGDVAELGVWRGDTFAPLARLAGEGRRTAYAVDSFAGMAAPGPLDTEEDGTCHYPQGALRVDAAAVQARLTGLGPHVRIVTGYVPDVLFTMPPAVRLAFVHLDLDHYEPTLAALKWLWIHMAPGGILCCHDWFPGRRCLAAAAIAEWHERHPGLTGHATDTRHIWFEAA